MNGMQHVDLSSVDDLASLETLDDDVLLKCLKQRFQNCKFYTYVGDVLVAINPCEHVQIYGEEYHRKYKDLRVRKNEAPHVFWTADYAYRNLLDTRLQQCIVVNGDSGAGKTENTKYALKHLIQISPCQIPDLVDKISKVNPLIELFGNASTIFNQNSSRFGKLIELSYVPNGTLLGAKLQTFVFEKSRVVHHGVGEKNFHVFHAMFAGIDEEKLLYYFIENPNTYRILQEDDAPFHKSTGTFRNAEEQQEFSNIFQEGMSIFRQIGFSEDDIYQLIQVLAAVLHIGNIEFIEDEEIPEAVTIKEEKHLKYAADNLQIQSTDRLVQALISKPRYIRGERVESFKTLRQADDGKDALAKELYKSLFDGVIDRINHALKPSGTHTASDGQNLAIGILDISGFENLRFNSFEQLLINVTNERLHQYFQQQVFESERNDYHMEGVAATEVPFKDNDDVLDLLFRRPGIIAVLEEELAVPGSSDKTLVMKYNKFFRDSPAFQQSKHDNMFIIKHYAGKVKYCADGFLEKNKGTLADNLRMCFSESGNTFIRHYFCHDIPHFDDSFRSSVSSRGSLSKESARRIKAHILNTGTPDENMTSGGKLHDSVTSQYKKSLYALNDRLSKAKPLFIRCIKPNVDLAMGTFDERIVKTQLKSCGVLEVTKIRKEGYPVRMKIDAFLKKFQETWKYLEGDEKTQAETILRDSCVTHFQIGKTKIFMKADGLDQIERKVAQIKEEQQKRRLAELQRSHQNAVKGHSDVMDPSSDTTSICSEDDSSISTKDRKLTPPPSYISVQGMDDISKDDTMSTENENEPEPLPAWDIFRVTERETEESNVMEERCLIFARMFVYTMLFLGILFSGIGSMFGLLTIASGLKWETEKEGQFLSEILLCYSLPAAITFFVSLGKILFGRKEGFQLKYFLMVLFFESMQACGTGFLVFKFLPFYNTIICIIYLMAPLQLPSIFNIHRTLSRKRGWKFKQRLCVTLMAVFAVVIQWGFPTMVFTTGDLSSVDPDIDNAGLVIISLCLISCGWCHVFFGDNIKLKYISLNFQKWRTEITKSRDTINLLTCPVKIGVFFLVAYRIYPETTFYLSLTSRTVTRAGSVINGTQTQNISEIVYDSVFVEYSALIIQVVSSLLCTYLCGLACKIQMQKIAFAIPLILFAPSAFGLASYLCWLDGNEVVSILEGRLVCPSMTYDSLATPIGCLIALTLSVIFITWYIWFPSSERMAKTENLFMLPVHDGIFSALSMLLRRKDDTFERTMDKHHHTHAEKRKNKKIFRPFVNICATMWHESRVEMLQLLKSLFRLDKYHSQNKLAEMTFDVKRDYFDLAVHVIFDDAFLTEDTSKQRIPNQYVQQLVECIDEAVMSVAKGRISWERNPKKFSTPYGGRLEWIMPGGTKMIFHLKDKSKTRHRKRWSQILYLYYLLGYELMGTGKEDDVLRRNMKRRRPVKPFTSLLNQVPPDKLKQAYNTYILTLDGDVDFRPEAVKLLIDRMTKNDKVAAVCGRIHPIGSGPMVWYQQFEYAVGHWLQKATEHVFGCVLCCPGCFSLFRFAALIDDNVVKMYTTAPAEARHYIQFEQGEDRWLCTLLLQQGWKIDYCAGADSFTYAPETFKEFFIQRRRWAPSTMANIMDLLSSWKSTVKVNDNISTLFILYQFILMTSSLLGPGTVTLMIAGSYSAVFGINMYYGFLLAMTPVVFFIVVCLKTKNDTQIYIAGLLSSVYCIVMVIVTVGTLLNILEEDFLSPNVIFLAGLAIIFSLAGIWHPKEMGCLAHGILYYLTVPSTFVFLTIYFLCNLNVVSWGTREAPKKLTEEEEVQKRKEEEKKARKKAKGNKFCRALGILTLVQEISGLIRQGVGGSPKEETKTSPLPSEENQQTAVENSVARQLSHSHHLPIPQQARSIPVQEPEMDPTYWGRVDFLGNENAMSITESEEMFWKDIIAKYLYPIEEDSEKQEQIRNDLRELRNNVVFGYFLLNLLFTIAIFQLQVNEDKLQQFFILGQYEPLSLAFLAVFAIVLILQFIGMFLHRWGTFLHLISSTTISSICAKTMDANHYSEEAFREAGRLQNADPDPNLLIGLESETTSSSLDTNSLTQPSIMEPDYPDDVSINEECNRVNERRLDDIAEGSEDMAPDYSDDDDDQFANNFPRPRQEPVNAYERNFSRRIETLRRQFRHHERRNSKMRRQSIIFSNLDNDKSGSTRRRELYYRTIGRRHSVMMQNI